MIKQYKCINCGKNYESYKENSKFCSIDCKRQYNNVEYECDCCGKKMIIPKSRIAHKSNHIYCGRDCMKKGFCTSVENTCKNCGKKFTIYKSMSNQQYCSHECYIEYKNNHSAKQTKTCKYCNKEFTTYHKDQIYCSYDCSSMAQRKRVGYKCEYCGKLSETKLSEYNKNSHHFCSVECKYNSYRWSEEDIDIVKQFYHKVKIEELQKMLSVGRSIKAITSKAIMLGITEDRSWSVDEEKILVDYYGTKPMNELLVMLPKRNYQSILVKSHNLGLLSYYYINRVYSDNDIQYLKENYLDKTDDELAEYLHRTPSGVKGKLYLLGLFRPRDTTKLSYTRLNEYIRSFLHCWKRDVLKKNSYMCCLSKTNKNLVIHHCRSLNLILEETLYILGIEVKENFNCYSEEELDDIVRVFLDLQEYYGQYVCINSDIHILFHKEYGFGDNTIEQWNEFVERYKSGCYENVLN